jgi:hypothetical protein
LWFTGFRRITSPSKLSWLTFAKRDLVSIALLLVLAIVLTGSLQQVVARHLYETNTRFTLQQEINASVGNYLEDVRFETDPGITIVRAVVRGPNAPSAAQVAAMEATLPAPPDQTTVELRVRYVVTSIINRNGLLYTDAAFGTSQ